MLQFRTKQSVPVMSYCLRDRDSLLVRSQAISLLLMVLTDLAGFSLRNALLFCIVSLFTVVLFPNYRCTALR